MMHGKTTVQTDKDNKYLCNGKELQMDFDLNWYDYGARFYDTQLGRWRSVVSLAEKYASWSPYNYVRGNPIMRIDLNGMYDTTFVEGKDKSITTLKKTKTPIYFTNESGGYVADENGGFDLYDGA